MSFDTDKTDKHGEMATLRARITGHVQGVGFRVFARDWANRLGLSGYVRNNWDGSVQVVAIGERKSLGELLTRLEEGPLGARVRNVEVEWLPAPTETEQASFEVRH